MLSFREMRLTRPDLGTGFVGLRHHVDIWHDQVFWNALQNTLKWVTIAVLLELALGMGSALALDRDTTAMRVLTVCILLPWFGRPAAIPEERRRIKEQTIRRRRLPDQGTAAQHQPT